MRDLVAELEARDISARIKKARKEAGLTQEQLADLLEVIPRSVQNYESDRVPWNKVNQIAKITGKTSEWILHGEAPNPFEGQHAAGTPTIADVLDRLDAMQTLLEAESAANADLRIQIAELAKRPARRASGDS